MAYNIWYMAYGASHLPVHIITGSSGIGHSSAVSNSGGVPQHTKHEQDPVQSLGGVVEDLKGQHHGHDEGDAGHRKSINDTREEVIGE
ncbi:hypothetical protein EON63_21305 [archaeon]|nr:MAG: hypothetical protein EON63_21305 [archaeon]